MDNIYLKLMKMAPVISNPVLTTVTLSEGSTPQKPGSSAIFGNKRLITGTVGGGAVEWKTNEFAIICGQTKKSRFFHYALDNDISETEDAICGGRISILIDADPLSHLSVFAEMKKSLSERQPGVLITKVRYEGEDALKINRYWITENTKPDLPAEIINKIWPLVSMILASADTGDYKHIDIYDPIEKSTSTYYLELILPVPQLIIAGAGHIGKALSHLGKLTGFEVTVVDNRGEFANSVNLPDADHIIVQDIGKVMEEVDKCADTYIVIVTRGHRADSEALKSCIGTEAAYIGMIGSKAKVAKMHSDFIQKGWATEDQWKAIYTPIGLQIKSKTVEEIAISIIAQLILVKNSKKHK